MINKLVVDGKNIILNESTVLPFTYSFSTAGVHEVSIGLDNTNEICAYAFKDCEDLTNVVNIPEQITMIKRNAFENCSKLSKFNVPDSINYIGPNVFDGCTSLKEIKFDSENPPKFLSVLGDSTTCYIPDGSKYVKVEDNSNLVKDGSVQYYEKNILGGYDSIDYELLDDNGEYYYDQWVDVHDHYNVIEERFRIKPTQINFVDNGVVTTLYGDVNAGEEGEIFEHEFIPENSTNSNVFIYSTNENILTVDQNGHFTTNGDIQGNANVNVCICTEPDYNGSYAFTQLRFRVRTRYKQVDLNFPENYSLDVNNVEIGNTIEFETPTLTGDNTIENPTFEYTSSNENVAKFEDGNLIAKGNGTTTITATYPGDSTHNRVSSSFELNITNINKSDVIISFNNTEIIVNNSHVGAIIEFDAPSITGDNLENPTLEYTSSNENVAKFEDGNLVVVDNGEAIITAIYAGDDNHNSSESSFTVTISIKKEDVTISFENDEVNIEGNIGDIINIQEATCSLENAELVYSFEHDEVIDEENKSIVKAGTVIVTATYEGDTYHNPTSAQYTINITIKDNVESEYDTDENGDIQIINPNEQPVESEYDTDEDGDIQIINNNKDSLENQIVNTEYTVNENNGEDTQIYNL